MFICMLCSVKLGMMMIRFVHSFVPSFIGLSGQSDQMGRRLVMLKMMVLKIWDNYSQIKKRCCCQVFLQVEALAMQIPLLLRFTWALHEIAVDFWKSTILLEMFVLISNTFTWTIIREYAEYSAVIILGCYHPCSNPWAQLNPHQLHLHYSAIKFE